MANNYQTKTAIIFKLFNAKDADRVIHMLGEDGSRVPAFAKGVKKSSSRKSHAVDLLNLVSYRATDPRGGLPSITEIKVLNQANVFKQDYPGLIFTQAVCEVIDSFAAEEVYEPGFFSNLTNLMSLSSDHNLAILLSGLILRFLYLSGDLPKLNEDVTSGDDILPESPRYTGEFIGYSNTPWGEPVSDRIFKVQRFMLRYDFGQIQKLGLEPGEQIKLQEISLHWLEFSSEKEKKACRMFYQLLLTSHL